MTIQIPDNYMGKPIKGSMEKVLAEAPLDESSSHVESIVNRASASISDPERYIILPGKTRESYSYPDLLVAMDRTYQGKNWNECHAALAQENSCMINMRQFVDFLNLLKSGRAFDGNGSLVAQSRIESILDEIWTVRSPYRAEWLDAKFKIKGGNMLGLGKEMHINYDHRMNNGQPLPSYSGELTDYLKSDKTTRISMDDWLVNANKHGLPKEDARKGDLYYWHPKNGSVAGFIANSDWVVLICSRYPTSTGSSLGVRAVREK